MVKLQYLSTFKHTWCHNYWLINCFTFNYFILRIFGGVRPRVYWHILTILRVQTKSSYKYIFIFQFFLSYFPCFIPPVSFFFFDYLAEVAQSEILIYLWNIWRSILFMEENIPVNIWEPWMSFNFLSSTKCSKSILRGFN